jgi:hypothetical protein
LAVGGPNELTRFLVDGFTTKITRADQELRGLVHPSAIDLSSRHPRELAQHLAARHREIGIRWRRTPPGPQALLVLAHLCRGYTYACAAGSGIGIATVYHSVREATEILTALAPTLAEAMRTASRMAFVILDGTLLPIDRIAADAPYYSGKHKRRGMDVQALTDPFGRLLWASLPRSTHNLTVTRTHGIVDALTNAGLKCWADKSYQGANRLIRVPFRGRRLKPWKRRHNSSPRSAASANRPWPPSWVGASCETSTAVPTG